MTSDTKAIGQQALTIGAMMCAAAIYFPLRRRGLISAEEVEEALNAFDGMLETYVSQGGLLHPDTPAGARAIRETFLSLIKSPEAGPRPWQVFEGGKKD